MTYGLSGEYQRPDLIESATMGHEAVAATQAAQSADVEAIVAAMAGLVGQQITFEGFPASSAFLPTVNEAGEPIPTRYDGATLDHLAVLGGEHVLFVRLDGLPEDACDIVPISTVRKFEVTISPDSQL